MATVSLRHAGKETNMHSFNYPFEKCTRYNIMW
jgi:hypothetical protein